MYTATRGAVVHTQERSIMCSSFFFAFFVSPIPREFTLGHCFYLTLVQVSQNVIPIFLMNNACSLLSMLVDINSQPPKHRCSSMHSLSSNSDEVDQSRRTRTAAPNKHKLVASMPIDGRAPVSSELKISSTSHAVPTPLPSVSAWSGLARN